MFVVHYCFARGRVFVRLMCSLFVCIDVWVLFVPLFACFVLCCDFCGFVCVYGAKHPKFGTIIDNLHVNSDVKGKGIGTKLLVSAATWAVSHYKTDNLYLEVLECNSKAIGFYETLGGKNIDIAYWHTPCGNKVKEFIYSWGLPENLANK